MDKIYDFKNVDTLIHRIMIVVIAQWIGGFFTGIVTTIFGLLSTPFWVIAIIGYVFGALTRQETWEMIVVSFRCILSDFIHS